MGSREEPVGWLPESYTPASERGIEAKKACRGVTPVKDRPKGQEMMKDGCSWMHLIENSGEIS